MLRTCFDDTERIFDVESDSTFGDLTTGWQGSAICFKLGGMFRNGLMLICGQVGDSLRVAQDVQL